MATIATGPDLTPNELLLKIVGDIQADVKSLDDRLRNLEARFAYYVGIAAAVGYILNRIWK